MRAAGYVVAPVQSAEDIAAIVMAGIRHDAFFSDYCASDVERATAILSDLAAPNTLCWSIRREGEVALCGILRLTQVRPLEDAKAHFVFFDGLVGSRRMALMAAMIDEVLYGSLQLHRLTAEIPAHMAGLERIALRLGFEREGIRREAMMYDGKWQHMYLLGYVRR